MYIKDFYCLFPFLTNINVLDPYMHCVLTLTSSDQFAYMYDILAFISLGKYVTLNPSAKVCLVPNFVKICTVVLDEQSFKCCHCIFTILHYLILEKWRDP